MLSFWLVKRLRSIVLPEATRAIIRLPYLSAQPSDRKGAIMRNVLPERQLRRLAELEGSPISSPEPQRDRNSHIDNIMRT